jgi:hypothetical protein
MMEKKENTLSAEFPFTSGELALDIDFQNIQIKK